jgi:hypothetical protein
MTVNHTALNQKHIIKQIQIKIKMHLKTNKCEHNCILQALLLLEVGTAQLINTVNRLQAGRPSNYHSSRHKRFFPSVKQPD